MHVEKITFALNKIIDYHSKSPKEAIKREIDCLLKFEAGGVSKMTAERQYERSIVVPMTAPSQDFNTSRLIHINYELKVEAKLGVFHKSLMVTAPITVRNVPHYSCSNIPSNHSSGASIPNL